MTLRRKKNEKIKKNLEFPKKRKLIICAANIIQSATKELWLFLQNIFYFSLKLMPTIHPFRRFLGEDLNNDVFFRIYIATFATPRPTFLLCKFLNIWKKGTSLISDQLYRFFGACTLSLSFHHQFGP